MNIICLAKRRPQQKDLITRPYGRFYYLPYILAQRGHNVSVALLSYKADPSLILTRSGVQWNSESIFHRNSFRYIKIINSLIQSTRPDWIVGFSDTYYGILAAFFGLKYRIHFAIDAYDNYESYLPWFKPLHYIWHKALSNADVVTAAGPQLAAHLNKFRPGKHVAVVPMAADPIGFVPIDKIKSRKEIGLPLSQKIVGYCGAVHKSRGIDVAFQAFDIIKQHRTDVAMVLSGRKDKSLAIPPNICWLGYLPDRLMPMLLNAIDVLLVINRLSDFGKYSYPVKLYEAMNCQTPVIATSTGATRWILGNREAHLSNPEDPHDLARKIMDLLDVNEVDYGCCNKWEYSADLFEKALAL
jgi:glycosyltransferase involved in cell wall biosynthesis